MTDRTCCFIGCAAPADFQLLPYGSLYEFTDACTKHVGELLSDAPETTVTPIWSDYVDTGNGLVNPVNDLDDEIPF